MMDDTPNPLEEVSDDALTDELARRFDVAAFIGYKMTSSIEAWKGVPEASTGGLDYFCQGPNFAVLGLLRVISMKVEDSISSIRLVVEEDDDEDAIADTD